MYKTISDLGKKSGWNAKVFQWEDSDEVKRILQGPSPWDHSKWYYVDFYRTDDYSTGIRIEGTKEDLQKIVDMLNAAINPSEETLETRTVSKPGAVLKVEAVPIPPKIQSKMAEAIRGEK